MCEWVILKLECFPTLFKATTFCDIFVHAEQLFLTVTEFCDNCLLSDVCIFIALEQSANGKKSTAL